MLKSRFPVWGKEQPPLCCGSWTCFQNSILLQSWPFQRIWYALTFQFVSKYFFDWSSSTLTFADRIASFACLWVLFCLLLTSKTLLQDRSSWGGNYMYVIAQWRTSTNSSRGTKYYSVFLFLGIEHHGPYSALMKHPQKVHNNYWSQWSLCKIGLRCFYDTLWCLFSVQVL